MVPMLRPGLPRLSSGGWDKRGVSSQPPDESLSKPGLSMRTMESPEIPQSLENDRLTNTSTLKRKC